MNMTTQKKTLPWQMNRAARIECRMCEIERDMTERLLEGETYSAEIRRDCWVTVGPTEVASEMYHADTESEYVDRALAMLISDPIAAQRLISPLAKVAVEQVIAGFPVRECAEFMEWSDAA